MKQRTFSIHNKNHKRELERAARNREYPFDIKKNSKKHKRPKQPYKRYGERASKKKEPSGTGRGQPFGADQNNDHNDNNNDGGDDNTKTNNRNDTDKDTGNETGVSRNSLRIFHKAP